MYYATSREIAGSGTRRGGFLNVPNPSSRTMALGSTQPLTEMSIRNFSENKKRPARGADNLTAMWAVEMWKPRRLTALSATTDCYRDSFTFTLLFRWKINFHVSLDDLRTSKN
jgi:hypothetical protein